MLEGVGLSLYSVVGDSPLALIQKKDVAGRRPGTWSSALLGTNLNLGRVEGVEVCLSLLRGRRRTVLCVHAQIAAQRVPPFSPLVFIRST